jgi:ABC-type transport system substrate-binding protein
MRKAPWNDTENRALCALYFAMRSKVDQGKEYNKAAMIREAMTGTAEIGGCTIIRSAPLKDRSKGSIEAKLMNLTAVLHDIGRAQFSMAEHGYRPLSNYQSDLKQAAVDYLNRIGIETAA